MDEAAYPPATIQECQITAQDYWWTDEADDVEGYDFLGGQDQEKDEALMALVGVPLVILTGTWRDGTQRKGIDYRDDYVSVELRVAPAYEIERRIRAGRLGSVSVLAGEQLGFNDGSTGVYRQITEYANEKGYITVPDGEDGGEKGESRFDLPRSQWLAGAEEATKGIEMRLRCPRGLRYSEYPSPVNSKEMVKTWYIA